MCQILVITEYKSLLLKENSFVNGEKAEISPFVGCTPIPRNPYYLFDGYYPLISPKGIVYGISAISKSLYKESLEYEFRNLLINLKEKYGYIELKYNSEWIYENKLKNLIRKAYRYICHKSDDVTSMVDISEFIDFQNKSYDIRGIRCSVIRPNSHISAYI